MQNNKQNSSYEPELFPGCVYMMDKTKILIFISGKIFMTGIKNKSEISKIFSYINTEVKKCVRSLS